MDILRGVIGWEMGWTSAFLNTKWLGTFNVGTHNILGTIFPRGGTNPLIAGTIAMNSGQLINMEAENEAAVVEEHSAMIYNITLTD